MKKKLLYLTSILLFSAASINAQNIVWNFSNNTVSGDATVASPAFPTAGVLTSGTATPPTTGTAPNTITVGGLSLYGHVGPTSSAFAAIAENGVTFPDGFVGVNRASTGGGSAPTGALPTVRYFTYNATGASIVKFWIKHTTGVPANPVTSPPSTRTLFVGNGTIAYGSGSVTNDATANTFAIVEVFVPNAGLTYIYTDNAIAIYKIESTLVPLSTDSFQAGSSVVVYANDGAINVSNVTSATKVSVYSVLGSLVKSIETSEDASVQINNGVYIVKAQSAEGTKTTKLIVQ